MEKSPPIPKMGWRIIGEYFGHAWHVKHTDTAFCTSESMNQAIIDFWQSQTSYARNAGQLKVKVLEYGPMQLNDRIITPRRPWRSGSCVKEINALKLDYGTWVPVQMYNPLNPPWDNQPQPQTTKDTDMQIRPGDKVEEGQLVTVNRKADQPPFLSKGGCPVIYEVTLATSQGLWVKRVTNPLAEAEQSATNRKLAGRVNLLAFADYEIFSLSDEEYTKLTGRTFPRPPKRVVEVIKTKCHETKIGTVTRHVVQLDSSVHGYCIARFYDVEPHKAHYRAHQFILGLVDDPKLKDAELLCIEVVEGMVATASIAYTV